MINDYLEVDAAAAIARQFDASDAPLVIADYADNPGAGAYGDATNLLNSLLEAGVPRTGSCAMWLRTEIALMDPLVRAWINAPVYRRVPFETKLLAARCY